MPISKIGTNSIDQSTPQQIGGVSVGQGAGAVSSNAAVGNGALVANTTGANSVAIGTDALRSQNTGGSNSAVGQGSMYTTTTGYYNVAMGNSAMYYNTTGYQNTALGVSALQSNTTANNNTAVGYQAGFSNTTGTRNTFLGYQAGYSFNDTGSGNNYNTFLGYQSGYYVSTGTKNTILGGYNGNQGGLDIRTANNYIVLSDGDGNPRMYCNSGGRWGTGVAPDGIGGAGAAQISAKNNTSGYFAAAFEGWYGVGINAPAGQDNSFMYFYYNSGGAPVGRIYTNGSTTAYGTSSDYRLKENIAPMSGALQKVMLLKPCTYTWKQTGENAEGFIAHELQEVIPEAVAGEKDAVFEDGSVKPQMVDTGSAALIATLTAAIQELKADLDATKAELAALKGQP